MTTLRKPWEVKLENGIIAQLNDEGAYVGLIYLSNKDIKLLAQERKNRKIDKLMSPGYIAYETVGMAILQPVLDREPKKE